MKVQGLGYRILLEVILKKDTENRIMSEEFMQRQHQRCVKRAVKMFSLILAGTMATVSCMIVPIGHADDTCLQVPPEQTLAMATGQASGTTYVELSMEDATSNSELFLNENTYVISATTDRDGIEVELLDPSAFTATDETMYVLPTSLSVHTEPSMEASLCGTVLYADQVTCIARGSSWSQIEFVSENESVCSGYVPTSKLTADVLATPTPTPTPTETPTPTPKKKKSTPTPEPVKETVVESTPTPTPKPSFDESEASGTFYSVGEVNVRSGPDTSYSALRKLSYNEAVSIVAKTSNGWYKLSEGGYVKASLLSATDLEAEVEQVPATTAQTPSSETTAPAEKPASGSRNIPSPDSCDLLTYARAFIGVPYVYCGASLDGLDCSGFVMYVYAHYYGISLPHQSASIAQLGTDVTSEDLKPGDVICHDYNNDGRVDHVSLYCGSGVVIHASTSNGGIIEDCLPMQNVVTVRRFV